VTEQPVVVHPRRVEVCRRRRRRWTRPSSWTSTSPSCKSSGRLKNDYKVRCVHISISRVYNRVTSELQEAMPRGVFWVFFLFLRFKVLNISLRWESEHEIYCHHIFMHKKTSKARLGWLNIIPLKVYYTISWVYSQSNKIEFMAWLISISLSFLRTKKKNFQVYDGISL
jgi:hypothetical protein